MWNNWHCDTSSSQTYPTSCPWLPSQSCLPSGRRHTSCSTRVHQDQLFSQNLYLGCDTVDGNLKTAFHVFIIGSLLVYQIINIQLTEGYEGYKNPSWLDTSNEFVILNSWRKTLSFFISYNLFKADLCSYSGQHQCILFWNLACTVCKNQIKVPITFLNFL